MEGSQKSEELECISRQGGHASTVSFLYSGSLYTDVVYFSFLSFGKHRRVRERVEHASEANHTRSTDFEEKIEGL